MSLRRAKHSDLPAITRIVGSAFLEEGLNAHIFPLRREFPDDYVRTWRMKLNEHWWDYSKVLMVATMLEKGGLGGGEEVDGLDGGDGEKEVIVGATVWMREGDGWEKLWGVWRWDPSKFILDTSCSPFSRAYGSSRQGLPDARISRSGGEATHDLMVKREGDPIITGTL